MIDAWVLGLCILTSVIIKTLVGLDLGVSQWSRHWWSRIWKRWEFWMGIYFVVSAVFFNGAVGMYLLGDPYNEIGLGLAIPIVGSIIALVIGWALLIRERRSGQ